MFSISATLVKGSFPSVTFPESALLPFCGHAICLLCVVCHCTLCLAINILPYLFAAVRSWKSLWGIPGIPADDVGSSYLLLVQKKNKFIILDNFIGEDRCNNVKSCRASGIMDFCWEDCEDVLRFSTWGVCLPRTTLSFLELTDTAETRLDSNSETRPRPPLHAR